MAPKAWLAVLFALAPGPSRTDVRLPFILADHMVVQRDLPVHIWGTAAAGDAVTVTFRGASRVSTADAQGRWSVYLPPGSAGGPFELTVRGSTNTITLKDVMAGDVWIASGQSNMEWPVRWAANAEAEQAAGKFPNIRLVRTMHRVREYPAEDWIGATWAPCSPESVEHFSAVGYYFGRILHQKLGIPIGLIQTAWGGTPAEAWTSMKGISADAGLMPVLAEWARIREARTDVPNPPGDPYTPSGLFNAMVAPLTKLPIRGVIWYQGEANTSSERAPYYERLFPALIRDWRRAWGQGDFPFLFVQLANYKADPESMWPLVREAQRQTLWVANTAMAITIDIGTPGDIHPLNKQDVGTRLALAARALVYGERIEYSGPLFRQATVEGSDVRLWFDHAAGLMFRDGEGSGFEVAGRDGRFHSAHARIDGATVVVTSAAVKQPVNVRYAWSDNPAAALFNSAGLPASPFRTNN